MGVFRTALRYDGINDVVQEELGPVPPWYKLARGTATAGRSQNALITAFSVLAWLPFLLQC